MMSVLCVAIFWVLDASSGEKCCLQFSITTGSGAGGEGGVSHRLKESFKRNTNRCLYKNEKRREEERSTCRERTISYR